MVKFLPGAPAALIESITRQVHDVEGIHDRPRAGEFFSSGALKAGESIHRDNLNALAPRIGLGGQPSFEDLLGSARDHVQEPGGTAAIVDGRHVQDDGDVCVPVGGVSPHVFIHADDTHAVEPNRGVDERALTFGQDSSVGGIPGHAQGLGDARHRHMMNNYARQRPAHRHARELRTRIGRLAHVLAPHVSKRLAPVAANAHVHDRGTPPAGLVRQASDYRVTRLALAPAASTPPVLTSNTARQHCMVWPHALTRHLQPQAIQARERTQIRAIKDSIGHVEVFQMDGVGTLIIGRPQPLPGHDTPNPTNNTYTFKCKEPQNQTRPVYFV